MSTINSIQGMEPQDITHLLHLGIDEVEEERNDQYMVGPGALIISVSLQMKVDRCLPAQSAALPFAYPFTLDSDSLSDHSLFVSSVQEQVNGQHCRM